MTRLSWYKRDPAAFLDGTMTLTLEETGAYAKILELIYVRDGACPDNERWIAGHLNCEVRTWRRLRARLIELGKLYVDGDALHNARADSTIASGLDRLNQTISAGKRSGEERRKSASKSGDFNGSGGTPVPTDAPTGEREIKTKIKKEKKETLAAAPSPATPARAREETAPAEPAAAADERLLIDQVMMQDDCDFPAAVDRLGELAEAAEGNADLVACQVRAAIRKARNPRQDPPVRDWFAYARGSILGEVRERQRPAPPPAPYVDVRAEAERMARHEGLYDLVPQGNA